MSTYTLQQHIDETDVEWSTIQYFKDVVEFLKIKKIKKVLDVGGCTGQVSVILLHEIPSITDIIIIEAVEDNFNFIQERANSADTANINVIHKALFYGSPTVKLGRCDYNVGGWSVNQSNNQTEVETITLEEFSDIDFVKIDIEGAEMSVISNSTYIHEIPFIEIEFHYEYLDQNLWREYVEKNLTNHVVKFEGSPNRPQNAFLVRKDLIEF
jgi:FkbM family methyltransferase